MAEPSCDRAETRARRSRPCASDRASTPASRFPGDARGSTAMEYAMIGALIFVVAAGSVRYYGSRMVPIYNRISTAVSQGN